MINFVVCVLFAILSIYFLAHAILYNSIVYVLLTIISIIVSSNNIGARSEDK